MPEALLRESGRKSSACRKTARCSYIYTILRKLAMIGKVRRSCTRDTMLVCVLGCHRRNDFKFWRAEQT